MSKKIYVADEYRKNKLSLEPGGSEVTVVLGDGTRLVYDKIKDPYRYVLHIHRLGKDIREVYVNGQPFDVDFEG
jgi:hypothetical protein